MNDTVTTKTSLQSVRATLSGHGLATLGCFLVALVVLPFCFRAILSSGFLPHSYCYLLDRGLIALHVSSDTLIWLAYMTIAATLSYTVRVAGGEIPFSWMFLAFGTFIVACGFTHLMEVITLWNPMYWLAGYVKAVTAVVSVATAAALPFIVPKITAMTRAAAASEQVKADLAASNRDLEAFAYSISHDLRAPLRQVDGFCKILASRVSGTLDGEALECLSMITGGTRQMAALVDALLDFSRLGRRQPKRQTVDLDLLVTDVVSDFRRQLVNRDVHWEVGKLSSAECDPQLMKQVFVNLVSNAVKFSQARHPALIEIGQRSEGGERVFWVKDNGVGFNMNHAGKLFGVFQRLHLQEEFEGTGVGLANVQRIILKHGGRVWVQAEPDVGATFLFTLGNGMGGPKLND